MDSHPKKKKEYKANQKSNHGHVVGRDQYSLYSIQSKSKPNPITQHYNTEVFIKKKKKKRNQIQSKPNPRPRANQTHGETVTSLAGAARSVARRSRLVVIARSPLVVARRFPIVADRSHYLSCSGARPQGISLSFSL